LHLFREYHQNKGVSQEHWVICLIIFCQDVPFSEILKEAIDMDLQSQIQEKIYVGNDVGRNYWFYRELDLQNEFEEIAIQNLIPEHLRRKCCWFLDKLKEFDPIYDKIKADQNQITLRYIGNCLDLQNDKGFWK
jgi:aspartokinase/homoserine dehydrogenase 1